jgi:hypothetical protein
MLSRALSLATVTLLVGCLTAAAVRAVENLEAGKSPAQIFAGTCNACHKSPRGLLRSVPASSLSGFLRQHYTTSSDMASVLSSYLVANGATDTRVQGKQGKDGAKEGTKEAARAPADQPGAKQQSRLPRPGETPDAMRPDGPVQAAIDPRQKQKLGKKGRPEEPARTEPADAPKETAKVDEGAKPAADSAKPDSATPEPAKTEPAKTESAKVESAKEGVREGVKEGVGESAATRPDPVPAVTPAPAIAAVAPSTSPGPAPGASTVPVQPLDSPAIVIAEPKAAPKEVSREVSKEISKAPEVAAAPALPPVPPAGPPAVPISQ